MDYKSQIEAYFSNKQDALIESVTRLCSIRSVKEDAQPGMPFGPGPARCLDEALALASEMGLSCANCDGYVGTVDLNDKPTSLHILGHLDVVGEGSGWTVCAPYAPTVADGCIYGRGVADDKGPMVAALMALQCIKDLNLPLAHNVRVILGTDEESGSQDIAYYYSKHPYAPYTFSPDADFPVINIEKGMYRPVFTKAWPESTQLPRLVSLQGGFRTNVIPNEAEAIVEGLSMEQLTHCVQTCTAATGAQFQLSPVGEHQICIKALGKGGHAMAPAACCNAITALLELVVTLPLAESQSKQTLHDLHALLPHGQTDGTALGIAQSDALSGDLTVAFTILNVTQTGLKGQFDSRVSICANEDNCKTPCEKAFSDKGFECIGTMHPAHHTPADSPFVQTLLRCYEQYTGQPGQCIAIGGGTYVHDIPGGVAFGPVMPGFDTNLHGPDERIRISDLMTAAKIFAQAILDLCG